MVFENRLTRDAKKVRWALSMKGKTTSLEGHSESESSPAQSLDEHSSEVWSASGALVRVGVGLPFV